MVIFHYIIEFFLLYFLSNICSLAEHKRPQTFEQESIYFKHQNQTISKILWKGGFLVLMALHNELISVVISALFSEHSFCIPPVY